MTLSYFFLNYPLLAQKYMVVKNGRYQINMDVLLFPWKLTYKNPGSCLVPKGSFGKVHLAQDTTSRKRMACKLVSPAEKKLESCLCWLLQMPPWGIRYVHTPAKFCLLTEQLHLFTISLNDCNVSMTFTVFFFHETEPVKLVKKTKFLARIEIGSNFSNENIIIAVITLLTCPCVLCTMIYMRHTQLRGSVMLLQSKNDRLRRAKSHSHSETILLNYYFKTKFGSWQGRKSSNCSWFWMGGDKLDTQILNEAWHDILMPYCLFPSFPIKIIIQIFKTSFCLNKI